MNIYQLSTEFQELFNSLEAIEESTETSDDDGDPIDCEEMRQAWFDTLEGMEMEFEDKVENLAAYIKNIRAEAETLKTEMYRLYERKVVKENTARRLTNYLCEAMERVHLKKVDRPKAVVTVRNTPVSVVFEDLGGFAEWAKVNNPYLLNEKVVVTPDKTKIKKALQGGLEIEGVSLKSTKTAVIK